MISSKKILIIGGTGSLGNELTQFYSQYNNEIIILSRDENKQWFMKRKFPDVKFIIGDMRNITTIERVLREISPNIIIIAGAIKHVDIAEQNIGECIDTNITGVRNIIETVIKLNDKNIESTLLISTDKSCAPINVYGMCKSISERMIAEASTKKCCTKFLCVRYGNVLNSRGSIIPKFIEMGKNKEDTYFPITNLDMTRFFMTLKKSVQLINTALCVGISGDTWIPVINSFSIYQIANYFSLKYNKQISLMGIRAGEKIHECLINQSEIYRTVKTTYDNDIYYVIKPCYNSEIKDDIKTEYTSENTNKDLSILHSLLDDIINKTE